MLDIEHLTVIFNEGTVNEKKALDDLNLHLDDGDFVTIIGSNGAGKSTLLGAIAGNVEVKSGRILNNGYDMTYEKEYRRSRYIGRLYQDPLKGTAPHMTIEENLGLAYGRGKRMRSGLGVRKSDEKLFHDACAKLDLGLEDRMKNPVGTLSGGQRQALTLLMATLQSPKLLLLDEHTAALDPKTAHKVLTLTEKIVTENKLSTLMVTHNMKDAIRYGNRLVMMHEGTIIYDVCGEEKKNLQVADLLAKFEAASNGEFANDRMLLT